MRLVWPVSVLLHLLRTPRLPVVPGVVDPSMHIVAMLCRLLTCNPTVTDDRAVKRGLQNVFCIIGFFAASFRAEPVIVSDVSFIRTGVHDGPAAFYSSFVVTGMVKGKR